MKSVLIFAFVAVALGACSSYEKGEVTQSSDREIRIAIEYDEANRNVDTARQAAEHCADNEQDAIWYGHDKDGNLVHRCE